MAVFGIATFALTSFEFPRVADFPIASLALASLAGEIRLEADFGIAGSGGFFEEMSFIEFSADGCPKVACFELSSSKWFDECSRPPPFIQSLSRLWNIYV